MSDRLVEKEHLQERGDELPKTTMELLEEYAEILELANHYRQIGVPLMWVELKHRLEDAYARETVHGGLVHAGRLAKEARKKTQERKDPSDGRPDSQGIRFDRRPAGVELSVAGDLRAEKSGAEVPGLVEIIREARNANAYAPKQVVPNAYDLIEALARHMQRIIANQSV